MAIARHLEVASSVLRNLPNALDRYAFSPEFEPHRAELCRQVGREMSAQEAYALLLDARKRGLGAASPRRRRASAQGVPSAHRPDPMPGLNS